MCAVSHPLPPHAYPALTIQLANCTTLSEYAREAELHFTPDTAVVSFHLLMPLIQILQLQLATSLAMCGEPSSSS